MFFLTCSWRFLGSKILEYLKSKLEKIIRILKSAGKVIKTWLQVGKDSKHSSAARLFSHATYMGMAKVFFNRVFTLIMFASKGMYLELTSYTM